MHFLYKYKKAKTAIGLDIHATEVRLVTLTGHLYSGIKKALPKDTIVENRIKNPHAILQAIEELSADFGEQKKAAIALPIACVMSKHVTLPGKLSSAECESEFINNFTRYFPEINEKPCMDFVVTKKTRAEKNILLLASRQDIVEEYRSVVSQSGWIVGRVDVDMYAKARGLSYLFPDASQSAYLEVEGNKGVFLILKNGGLIFHHAFVFDTEEDVFPQIKYALKLSHSIKPVDKIYVSLSFPEKIKTKCQDELPLPLHTVDVEFPAAFWTGMGLALSASAGNS